MINIFIVDDHGVLRAGLAALLNGEPGMQVIGEAGSGRECLSLLQTLRPDIILMDISLPDTDGIHLTKRVLAAQPHTKVIMLTVHEDESLLKEALRSGAVGYTLKRAAKAEFITAIQAVVRGDIYVHPSLTRALLVDNVQVNSGHGQNIDLLTPREIEVLRLIALGYTNSQVATQLSISMRTVEYHRANLMGKLQLSSRVDVVRFASEHKLIEGRTPGFRSPSIT